MNNPNKQPDNDTVSEREMERAERALRFLADDPSLAAPRHLTQRVLAKLPRARRPILSPLTALFTLPRLALAAAVLILAVFASRMLLTRTAPRLVDETPTETQKKERGETTPAKDDSGTAPEHVATTDLDKELQVLLTLSDGAETLFEDSALNENPYASAEDDFSYDEEVL